MVHIDLKNISIYFPLLETKGARSLKNNILNKVGGVFFSEKKIPYIRALDNITINFNIGDRVGLVGHNGSGKSTFLKLLAGVYAPSTGVINIHGRISAILDIFMGLDIELTGYENTKLRSTLNYFTKKDFEKFYENVLEFSELGNFIDLPVKAYSNGMRLRLAFALATYMQPEIFVIDEMISVGDAKFAQKAENRLGKIIEKTKILFIASHNKDILNKYCNKIIEFKNGKIKIIPK